MTIWLFLCLLASPSFLLVHGASKSVLIHTRSPDGQLEIYARDWRGRAAKSVFFDKNESPISLVAMVTDGSDVLIKSEYDHHGKLVDCELINNPIDIDRFNNHIDDNIQKSLDTSPSVDMRRLSIDYKEIFDTPARVKACEKLLAKQTDQDENGEEGRSRKKRSYLIWPGTNWCGKGSKAEFADSYGPNKETDQCCQKHDQCPYVIEGFSTRYNLFNYRMHTLSHCECDQPFMSCLKEANTTTSNMVGKVYFNVVNTECFELNLQKSCAKRSWWGGCEKYTTKWTATIKSLGDYLE